GRSLPHAILMMIPEPWSGHETMTPEVKAFYEFHSALMEPWDGPASIAFTDGSVIGAVLDRNGLRPSRYYVTKDDLVIMASEVGVLDIPPERILIKERLHPGRIFLVDTAQGRIIDDEEIKRQVASQHPYADWLRQNLVSIEELPPAPYLPEPDHETVVQRQQAFGYTPEDLRILLAPMARMGEEPVGSMGTDTALAVLSNRPRLLFDYFKQLFAQVTNPPLDAIREELVTDMGSTIGPERNLLKPEPESCAQIGIKYPIIHNEHVAKLRHLPENSPFRSTTLSLLYGAGVVNPYVAVETIDDMILQGMLTGIDRDEAIAHYIKALNKGILKVMSKMGISTLQSYCGAQIFEAIGLSQAFIDRYFTHTTSRVGGVGIDVIAKEACLRHERAFGRQPAGVDELNPGGEYQGRRDGEYHLFNPETVFKLQHATRSGQYAIFKEYTRSVDTQNVTRATLRGLFRLKAAGPAIPIEEVEPAASIFKRFATGAMS